MAAPFAYEQPTLATAWDGVRRHLLTLLAIVGIGFGFNLLGYGLANLLFGGGLGIDQGPGPDQPPLAAWNYGLRVLLHQLFQTPFAVAASLVTVLLTAVPALYYETGKVVTPQGALQLLAQRPGRYLLAGILATAVIVLGLLFCILPGLAVILVIPIYINRIFVTQQPIVEAFANAFQAVFGHAKCWTYLFIQLVVWLLLGLVLLGSFVALALLAGSLRAIADSQNLILLAPVSLLFLGFVGMSLLGWLILPQMGIFYVQNAAYRLGILR